MAGRVGAVDPEPIPPLPMSFKREGDGGGRESERAKSARAQFYSKLNAALVANYRLSQQRLFWGISGNALFPR